MRKKIKQLMNKEEGFTLVELLAVIVILGIILAIAIPSISGVITRAQEDANKAEQEVVIDAARLYFTAGKDSDGDALTAAITEVNVTELKLAGFLEDRGNDGIVAGKVTRVIDPDGDKNYIYAFAE